MAQEKNKALLTRLADRGEQVVSRIGDLPGAKNLLDRTTQLAKGLDDVQKRLRSLGPIENRLTAVEKRLDKLEGKGATRKRPTTMRASTAKRAATPRRRPPSST